MREKLKYNWQKITQIPLTDDPWWFVTTHVTVDYLVFIIIYVYYISMYVLHI